MVSRDELYAGIQVRIIDSWDELPELDHWEAPGNEMDHWLGKVMTVKSFKDGWIKMVEDQETGERHGGWLWKENGFAEIVGDPMDKFDPSCDGLDALLGLEAIS